MKAYAYVMEGKNIFVGLSTNMTGEELMAYCTRQVPQGCPYYTLDDGDLAALGTTPPEAVEWTGEPDGIGEYVEPVTSGVLG
jgi:hypothetical protein